MNTLGDIYDEVERELLNDQCFNYKSIAIVAMRRALQEYNYDIETLLNMPMAEEYIGDIVDAVDEVARKKHSIISKRQMGGREEFKIKEK